MSFKKPSTFFIISCVSSSLFLLSITLVNIENVERFGMMEYYNKASLETPIIARRALQAYFDKDLEKTGNQLKKVRNASISVTIVLMGYSPKRIPNYRVIFKNYIEMTSLVDQIIFIWNNQEKHFPMKILPKKGVNLTFVRAEENSMNNRFNVSSLLNTDAVLVIDDDVLISEALIKNMLYKWYEEPHRLVGVDGRSATLDGKYQLPRYSEKYSIVIGKTMLFHRKYLDKYMSDKSLVDFNRYRFCEDIVMSALIYNATCQRPKILEKPTKKFRKKLPDVDGLFTTKPNWFSFRDKCVKFCQSYFGPNVFHCDKKNTKV